jgi:hypothetical protein
MTSRYAATSFEMEAERRREILSGSRFSERHVSPSTRSTHVWDGLGAGKSMSLRLAGVAGIAIAGLSQLI